MIYCCKETFIFWLDSICICSKNWKVYLCISIFSYNFIFSSISPTCWFFFFLVYWFLLVTPLSGGHSASIGGDQGIGVAQGLICQAGMCLFLPWFCQVWGTICGTFHGFFHGGCIWCTPKKGCVFRWKYWHLVLLHPDPNLQSGAFLWSNLHFSPVLCSKLHLPQLTK